MSDVMRAKDDLRTRTAIQSLPEAVGRVADSLEKIADALSIERDRQVVAIEGIVEILQKQTEVIETRLANIEGVVTNAFESGWG